MTGINLLPPEIKQERARAKLNTVIITICLYVFLLFLVGSIVLESANRYFSFRLGQKQSEIRNIESEIAKLKDVDDAAKNLNSTLSLIDSIESSRIVWSNILREMAIDSPGKLKLTSVSIDVSKSPNFNITGEADSPREAAKFREKLEDSSNFANTNFISTTRADNQGRIYYIFSIAMDLEKKKETAKK